MNLKSRKEFLNESLDKIFNHYESDDQELNMIEDLLIDSGYTDAHISKRHKFEDTWSDVVYFDNDTKFISGYASNGGYKDKILNCFVENGEYSVQYCTNVKLNNGFAINDGSYSEE